MDNLCAHQSLGRPIPCDEHACSVSIPTLDDVVGYEEGELRVQEALKIGYPRFKVHFLVEKLTWHMARPSTRSSFANDGNGSAGHQEGDAKKEKKEGGDEDAEEDAELDYRCYVFPTPEVAKRFRDFLQYGAATPSPAISIQSVPFRGVTAVYFPCTLAATAKAYWQHTGEIVSSRLAQDALGALGMTSSGDAARLPSVTPAHCSGQRHCKSDEYLQGVDPDGPECEAALRTVEDRILGVLGERRLPCGIHVTVSGMTAIFSALRLVKALAELDNQTSGDTRETSVVIFGFSYIDTLKIMGRQEFNKGGLHLLGHGGPADLVALRALLESQATASTRVAAVFTEYPSNPLLNTPDLAELSRLARLHDFLLVVDDTIGSFANVDLLHTPEVCADLLCSSLTKVFSGRGDVLAGSLVVNSHGARAETLRQLCPALCIPPLYGPDCMVLERNSRDYEERCARTSRTAWRLAEWLRSQPTIDAVYYPGVNLPKTGERFDSLCRHVRGGVNTTGRGCLLSIVLASDQDASISEARKDRQMQVFFDAMSCWKGPSLGTNFTLCCPYTLLAHYGELDWAKQFGIDRRLIRISVGLEEPAELEKMLAVCIAAATNAGRWTALHRLFVRGKGLPLPEFVRIFSFAF